jgi:serine/threonine protein kinase
MSHIFGCCLLDTLSLTPLSSSHPATHPGGTLSHYLCRHPVGEDVARYFFKQLLDAIAFCHARKMVYRDIKPANVLVTGTQPPFLKLCDFGLVSAAGGGGSLAARCSGQRVWCWKQEGLQDQLYITFPLLQPVQAQHRDCSGTACLS